MNFLSFSYSFICLLILLVHKCTPSLQSILTNAQAMDILDQLATNNELQSVLGRTNKYFGSVSGFGSEGKDVRTDSSTLSELYKIRMYLDELAPKKRRAVNMVPRLGRAFSFDR